MSECPFSTDKDDDVDQQHPIFVYIASDKRYVLEKHLQTTVPYIGAHYNPFEDIRRQNREPGFIGADHTTKAGAGSLQLELVIGPFPEATACRFRDEWRKLGRKLVSRVQKGIQQAMKYDDADVYCLDVEWAAQQMQMIKSKKQRTAPSSLSE